MMIIGIKILSQVSKTKNSSYYKLLLLQDKTLRLEHSQINDERIYELVLVGVVICATDNLRVVQKNDIIWEETGLHLRLQMSLLKL